MGEDSPVAKPDDQIFDDGSVERLLSGFNVTREHPAFPGFQVSLRRLGLNVRSVIRSTPLKFPESPFRLSLAQRQDWLRRNVQKPAETLIKALNEQNKPHFSTWPDHDFQIPYEKINEVGNLLPDLLAAANNLHDHLQYYRELEKERAEHTTELKYEIVSDLIDLFAKFFPELPRTRGTYDNDLRRFTGPFPFYVQEAYLEITGVWEGLDRPIRSSI